MISVLLSVYKNDNPDYLLQSVGSILSQEDCESHVFVGVDGPVGEELRFVLNQIDEDARADVIWFDKNRGLASVLNDLISLSKKGGYEYYARMDADDIAPTNRFIKQKSFLDSNPEIDVVSGSVAEMDENGVLTGKVVHFPLTHEECRKRFRYRDPLTHPGVMFRRSFFDKVNGYRSEYRKNQDTVLWLDGFLANCKFANIDDVVVNFRVNRDLYKNRRGGIRQAKRMLKIRWMINKEMHYDISAYLFSLGMFCLTIMPSGLRKFIYDRRP